MPTVGAVHAGTGRHRRYMPGAVYVAVILTYLADWGLPIGALKAVSESLPSLQQDQEEFWQAAIAGTGPIYLSMIPWSAADQPGVALSIALQSEEIMVAHVRKAVQGAFLNLTIIFSGISL